MSSSHQPICSQAPIRLQSHQWTQPTKLTELVLFIISALRLHFDLDDPVHQDDTSARPSNFHAFPDIFSWILIWLVVSPLETGPPCCLPSRTRVPVTLLSPRPPPPTPGSPNDSFFDPANLVNHVEDIPGMISLLSRPMHVYTLTSWYRGRIC